jgi:hypothetical protein
MHTGGPMEIAIIFLIVSAGLLLIAFATKQILEGIKAYKEEVIYEIEEEDEGDDDDDADYWKK